MSHDKVDGTLFNVRYKSVVLSVECVQSVPTTGLSSMVQSILKGQHNYTRNKLRPFATLCKLKQYQKDLKKKSYASTH